MTEPQPPDLTTTDGRRWLDSPDGRDWLDTDDAEEWITTAAEGWAWLNGPAGERWQRERSERGWDRYFAGRSPEPPPFAMSPASAPPVGTRVRFAKNCETVNGATTFAEGELAIIEEARFLPSYGIVSVTLRTLDGRRLTTTVAATFALA